MSKTVTFDHRLYHGDMIAVEFLVALQAQEGDITLGDAAAVGSFSSATSGTVSSTMSEAKAFWSTGVADTGTGTAITGFSTSTPREYFSCFISNSTGSGTWCYQDGAASTGTKVSAQNFAMGVRGMAAAGSTDLANAVFDWMMTFTSNSTYELPANASVQYQYTGLYGTYDPTIAPATLLTVRDSSASYAATKTNGSSVYALYALGLLASWYSTRQSAGLDASKNALSFRRAKRLENSDRDNEREWLPLLGECGLSYQPSYTTPVPASRKSVLFAAQVGNVYRYAPQAYLGRGLT